MGSTKLENVKYQTLSKNASHVLSNLSRLHSRIIDEKVKNERKGATNEKTKIQYIQ